MGKVGRKKKEYPEDEIRKIILSFVKQKGIKSEVPKIALSKYAKILYMEGGLPWLNEEISDNYWVRSERRGFQLIEEYNTVVHKTLAQNNQIQVNLPRIEDIVQQNVKDSKQLLKQLLPYQRELKISQQNYSVLQKELSELKDKLIKKNALIAILEKKIKLQQETIYQMFINGSVTNPKLRNLMKVGEEADSVVKEALQNIFNLKADEFLDLNSSVVNTKSEKIVEINKRQLKESLLDDFRSL
ncbi:TPA: hypothetical protein QCW10_004216 [Bacillus thuringiensis]|uniref:Uncharacterized protein n=3 Tax=Bacillus cereus group TaxID=86661 RepID=A0A643LUJ1_BACTU|nr:MULTISPECIES: hypothetical protein [Bacillus cereus group]AGE78003.1 hypothetical protein HD73_2425 [Bacillus thuringiensis serovar kurstaki str. HD73]AHZ51073.1 hypothetical protein YBT1520_11825 [Bacillus thuringiensis serovar kurstaki str. YBT-1520]AIE33484.1 hypothetical protein BTK_12025 [Bacillus thuringiensis serovar kurstaki str. HD-1]AJK43936.1 hypothetical protein BG08_3628 [Bacillus thuringiensis serovar kurstaki]AKJ57163.1 hypothetical protein XI92_02100 [Bacillus thuringiensis]